MVLWCYGILLISLTCMMGIWGPYMASALLTSSMVIGKFLIWFFWMDYFKVCVDFHPTSCYNILASSAPLIYCLWKHEFLLLTVLRNMQSVVWYSEKASFVVSKYKRPAPHCLNIILVSSWRCTLMNVSNSVSMVILKLGTTAARKVYLQGVVN